MNLKKIKDVLKAIEDKTLDEKGDPKTGTDLKGYDKYLNGEISMDELAEMNA